MVSEEEINHAVKRGNYYAIQSMLPELSSAKKIKTVLTKEFSSFDNVVSLAETRELLKKHHLLLSNQKLSEGGELLA